MNRYIDIQIKGSSISAVFMLFSAYNDLNVIVCVCVCISNS